VNGAVLSQGRQHEKVTSRIRATLEGLEAERKPDLELLTDVLERTAKLTCAASG